MKDQILTVYFHAFQLAIGYKTAFSPLLLVPFYCIFYCTGIGYAMIFTQAVVAIYYNVVNAWAFHYLFSSMTSALPWASCGQTWNSQGMI